MRLCVDARQLSPVTKTGKHFYTQSLIEAISSDHQLHLFQSPLKGPLFYLHFWFHLLFHSYDFVILPLSYLPILFSPLPTITIIYDLSFLHSQQFKPHPKAAFIEKLLLPFVVKKSRGLIFLNRNIRHEVQRYFNHPLPPATILPGLPRSFPKSPLILTLPNSYFLYLGTLEPRKNILNLIRGYHLYFTTNSSLHSSIPKLVIAGKPGWYYQPIFDLVDQLNLQNQIVFTGYLPNHQLPHLYKNALCLTYVPFYEGFGLPIIEALSFNLPVIASDHPVLASTAGPCGLIVDPNNLDQIARALSQIAHHPQTRRQLQRSIPTWISQFTPHKTNQKFNRFLHTLTSK